MESDCIERLQRISLTSDEGEIIRVHSDYCEKALEVCSLSLISRFLTTKLINSREAKSLLRSVWGLPFDLMNVEVGRTLEEVLEMYWRWIARLLHQTRLIFFESEWRCHCLNHFVRVLLFLALKVIKSGLLFSMSGYKGSVSTVEY
ncbi:hypothetical protein SO802_017908 [Lithocarpus litseifolius]|uniref:Uncharacterized protein n=1 Tax=Lithocarpus litseifolius TaxID=425828 RepID=A0AAW2CMP5_9ROSI